VKYKGKADINSTLGAVIQSDPKYFKSRIAEIRVLIAKMVENVNSMTIDEQRARLLEIDPNSLLEEPKKRKEIKIDLPSLDRFNKVILRLAPYPSGPLHIGNSRMVLLNDYCAKKYNGELLLVFDDTIGSAQKVIDPEAYNLIPEGLDYLGVQVHGIYYKSDRMKLFYKYAEEIIRKGAAYVCTCEAKIWKMKYKEEKTACPCRNLEVETNLGRWEKMLDGSYPEKAAGVRLKSGMDNPDPAIRDPVLLRISENEHPRVGTKYRVWPLLEFSWGIDDHELGISHIIRGKDLRKEGIIESLIWDIFGWKHPVISLYGRMKLKDLQLSKSHSAQKVRDGVFQDWTDPRTWSLQSLKRRGIHPNAIREALLTFGLNPVDITFSPENIYSLNRGIIDSSSNRYFFIENPIILKIFNVPSHIKEARPLLHPEFPERGVRRIQINVKRDYLNIKVPQDEINDLAIGTVLRLKDLMNIKLKQKEKDLIIAEYHSETVEEARKENSRMIQWVPAENALKTKILLVDGTWLEGLAELDLKNCQKGDIIQFERYAFSRIEKLNTYASLIWTHR